MKKILAGALLPFLSTAALAAGVPVIDASALSQALLLYQEAQNTVSHLQSQLSIQANIYSSLAGTRGLGLADWDSSVRKILPSDLNSKISSIASLGKSAMGDEARELYESLGLEGNCGGATGTVLAHCQKDQAAAATVLSDLNTSASRIETRSQSIETLMGRINSSTDPKAVADLTARLSAETALLEAESLRMQAVANAAVEQRRIMRDLAAADARKKFLRSSSSSSDLNE